MAVDDEVDLSDLDPGQVKTELLGGAGQPSVRRFELVGAAGPIAGVLWQSQATTCAIGSHESNDIVIADPAVSRFHCELRVERNAIRLHDLDSTNGTTLDGVPVAIGIVRDGSVIQVGRASLRVTFSAASNRLVVSERTEFGSLVGASWAMRACFAMLERAAAADATVLLEGESGTGKSSTRRRRRRPDRVQ